MKKKWTLGTRGSKLALKQTEIVVNTLRRHYPDSEFEIRTITTRGDTVWDRPLHLIGGKGLFVKEIEDELLNRNIDFAVHSMKDVPTEIDERLAIGAVLPREDPRDVLISNTVENIGDLRPGHRVGTNSLRRTTQLLHFRRNLEIVSLRGNVDTRIRKMEEQPLDAIVLAYAGVKRMGFLEHVREILPVQIMVPPSGQGAIGIETRNEEALLQFLKPVNHADSFLEVSVERALQAKIGGGCQVPLGINASLRNQELTIHLCYGTEDGTILFKARRSGDESTASVMTEGLLTELRFALEHQGHPEG